MFNKKEYFKQYRKDNKEKISKYFKQWRKDNRYNRKHQDNKKKSQLRCRYGLSLEDWLKIWEDQDGKCFICGKKFKNPSDAKVDHNHKTGEVRSLLCQKCNAGIGFFNDNPKLTAKATEYLLGER